MEEEPHGIVAGSPETGQQKVCGSYHGNVRKKDAVVSLERIDMLKLGSILPILANRNLNSSIPRKFFSFNQKDNFFEDYIRLWLTGGPSRNFTN